MRIFTESLLFWATRTLKPAKGGLAQIPREGPEGGDLPDCSIVQGLPHLVAA